MGRINPARGASSGPSVESSCNEQYVFLTGFDNAHMIVAVAPVIMCRTFISSAP